MTTAITIISTILAVLSLGLPLIRWVVGRTQTPKDDQALAVVEPILAMLAKLFNVRGPDTGSSSAALTAPQAPAAPAQLPLMYEREPEQPTRLRE